MAEGGPQAWTANKAPESIRRLAFVKEHPKTFGPFALEMLRKVVFLDRFPEAEEGVVLFNVSEEGAGIWACLSPDRRTLSIGAPGGINAASVCRNMFADLDRIEEIVFEENSFHTDVVKDFFGMFSCCRRLKSVNLNGFVTSEATSLAAMFQGCENLVSLDLSGFNTSKAWDFTLMFCQCSALEHLDVSRFDIDSAVLYAKYFDENLDAVWFRVPPKVSGMFSGCESLKTLDLSSFDTRRVENFSGMFENCRSLEKLLVSEYFIISEATRTQDMFEGCEKLNRAGLPFFPAGRG